MKHLQGARGGHQAIHDRRQPLAAMPALTSAKVQINIDANNTGLGVEVDWRWCGLTDFFLTI